MVFRDSVYANMKADARVAILEQIEAERDGEQVDYGLLRDVLAIFQEVGMGNLDRYEADFEDGLLADTSKYYTCKADAWIEGDTTPEYLVKAEESLKSEEERVHRYLHVDTKPKLLRAAEAELLVKHQQRLLEKENSGCAALLQDNHKDDLARMFRLFGRIPNGLNPMAEMFKKHVEGEGQKLVAQASQAVEAKKNAAKEKSSGGGGAVVHHHHHQQQQQLASVPRQRDQVGKPPLPNTNSFAA